MRRQRCNPPGFEAPCSVDALPRGSPPRSDPLPQSPPFKTPRGGKAPAEIAGGGKPPAEIARSSAPDQAEHLVALGLHVLARDEALEAQPQERLGVGRAHVEVPVVVVDRDAVELPDLRVAVARADRDELRGLVGHLRVDLARDEVARAVGLEQLRQRPARLAQQLEDQQRGQRPRVRVVEVGEVVMARDLAAEDAALLAHPGLEERVPDAVDERPSARGWPAQYWADVVKPAAPVNPSTVDRSAAVAWAPSPLSTTRNHTSRPT